MAIAYVDGKTGSSASNPETSVATSTWTATTGNCIVVGIYVFGDSPSITSVVDTASNSYSSIGSYNNGANFHLWLYLAQNITGHASNAVTVNISGGGYPGVCAAEFSGVSTTAAQDTGYTPAGLQTYPSPSTSNSDDTAVDNEVVVGILFVGTASTFDGSGGSTVHLSVGSQLMIGSKTIATAGAATIAFTYTADDFGHNLARALTPAATGQFARPAADRTDGNWLNEASSNVNLYESVNETAYNDSDYIRSAASPVDDTCTLDLSSISTPDPGTVTLRVRARWL